MNNKILSKRILFFDLDGTLIETESGCTFPNDISDMKIKRDVWNKIKAWIDNSYSESNEPRFVFIVTNQGGIETNKVKQGYFIKKIEYITSALQDYLGARAIVDWAMCETNEKTCSKRKPNDGMIHSLTGKYFYWIEGTDTDKMMMVGDASGRKGQFSDSDKKCAETYGMDYIDVSDFCELDIKCNEVYSFNGKKLDW